MSTRSAKRKETDDPSGSDGQGKRKQLRKDKGKTINRPSFLRIRLSDKTRQLGGLASPELICIPDITYLSNIADDCGYLYDLVSRVCEVDEERVKLYCQNDGKLRSEDDGGWTVVTRQQALEGGTYLCVVPEEFMATICVDPVLISHGENKSVSQTSSGASSPHQATTFPVVSPSKSATTSTNQSDPSSSKTISDNLLKQAVAKSMIDKIPEEKQSQDDRFKKTLEKRDKKCVISGTSWEHCEGSHVIPHSFVKMKIQLDTVFSLGDLSITDPNNPLLGVLLEPGLNHHFDRYELSVYTGNGPSGLVHVFRTETSEGEKSWVPSARLYEGQAANIRWTSDRISVFNHHYKHCVILAWGSDELQMRLLDFPEAGEDEFATMYDMDLDMACKMTSPFPPSSSAPCS